MQKSALIQSDKMLSNKIKCCSLNVNQIKPQALLVISTSSEQVSGRKLDLQNFHTIRWETPRRYHIP